jgi:ethanolamine utilization protein EutA
MTEPRLLTGGPAAGSPAGLPPAGPASDSLELATVGIDIGSATCHLAFSRVRLQRRAQSLSSRFVAVAREVRWRSPVIFTPYLDDHTIDAGALAHFIEDCYRSAGARPADVDTGAVILTGEALKRPNARAIAELFAGQGGRFVCATAGHHLEAALAAHGSGSVAFSRDTGSTVLHLDIGGGTTKLAVIADGQVRQTSAICAGGRLLVTAGGVAQRIDGPARLAASHLGLRLALGEPVPGPVMDRLAEAFADAVTELAAGAVCSPLARSLLVTSPPTLRIRPDALAVSGGVAEYLHGQPGPGFGDLAPSLARALAPRLERSFPGVPWRRAVQPIRATVIGAAQFTVQVSGSTVDLPDPGLLPLVNLPVLYPRIDLGRDFGPAGVTTAITDAARRMDLRQSGRLVALGFAWQGEPSYQRLRALAEGVVAARARLGAGSLPLVLLLTGDVARTLGRLLRTELGVSSPVAVLDGLDLAEFDYVDIGRVISPPGVVPVIIKSLLFGPSPAEPHRS